MFVVIDTSVAYRDWGFRRWIGKFAPDYTRTGHQLALPRVVFDEHWGQIERACTEWWRDRPKAQLELLGLELPASLDGLERLVQSRKADDENRLEDADVLILDYPREDHEEVAARAISRRRPFDSKGKDGYRDTLVWLSVLALCRQGDAPVAFITADHDLAADLAQEGFTSTSVVVFQNEIQFHQQYIDHDLRELSDVERQLKEGTYPFNLYDWLTNGPVHHIAGSVWNLLATKGGETPGAFLTPTIVEANTTEVRQGGPSRLIIYGKVIARLAAGRSHWPLGESVEVAVVTIDVRIVLNRDSNVVLDFDFGPASIEPLQPPGWFAAWP